MKKLFKKFFLGLLVLIVLVFIYFFVGKTEPAKEIFWGVNFSQLHSQNLGLDWKENYLALLDDLKIKKIKLLSHWNLIEKEKDKYDFEDLDWQIKETEKRNGKILLVLGMKTGRWPECHLPDWAKNLKKEEQQKEILELVENIVLRYQNSKTIEMWQVENEPFFPFGECPWTDKDFLKKEIALVKKLDNLKRPIVLTDSGEGSLWINAAQLGDMVGTTMYRKVWFSFSWEKRLIPFFPQKIGFYVPYNIPPVFYARKAFLIKKIFGKKVMVVEFQAEPWGPVLLYDLPTTEQEKTMNLEQFKKNIEFAKKTSFDTFYLWGGEWWYWLKEKQNKPEIWQEVGKLFQ